MKNLIPLLLSACLSACISAPPQQSVLSAFDLDSPRYYLPGTYTRDHGFKFFQASGLVDRAVVATDDVLLFVINDGDGYTDLFNLEYSEIEKATLHKHGLGRRIVIDLKEGGYHTIQPQDAEILLAFIEGKI